MRTEVGASPKTVKKVEFDTEVRELGGSRRRSLIPALIHDSQMSEDIRVINNTGDVKLDENDLCVEQEPGTSDL